MPRSLIYGSLSLWGVVLILSGCTMSPLVQPRPQPAEVKPVSADAFFLGKDWMAIAIDGVQPVLGPNPELKWTAPGQIVGTGGCNGFTGKALINRESIRIGPLVPTGKPCLTAPTGQEDMFFKALEDARWFRVDQGQWVLSSIEGKVLIRFMQVIPP